MDYRKLGDAYYIRMDRGDEVLSSILRICREENVACATYTGIGGCSSVEVAVFDPVEQAFRTERIEGMLEMVSITGSVFAGDGNEMHQHAHAQFSYVEQGEHRMIGGHVKATTFLYTAEIVLRPVQGGTITGRRDAETGTFLWNFDD
ncbi:MAG: PPC domain-containing DNA-binding protein [Coriobacteriales bacterium]|jgi:predicted DNA-binding protein with PD1-like motif